MNVTLPLALVVFVTTLTPAPETRTLAAASGAKLALRTVRVTVFARLRTG